jgi:hypothetical protein
MNIFLGVGVAQVFLRTCRIYLARYYLSSAKGKAQASRMPVRTLRDATHQDDEVGDKGSRDKSGRVIPAPFFACNKVKGPLNGGPYCICWAIY